MTVAEVFDPVILPIAFGIAVASVLLLFHRVWRRYPGIPARVPLRIGVDGRPSRRLGPKGMLWIAPVGLAAAVALVGAACFGFAPPRQDQHVLIAAVFLICAEVAWYVGWILDRQIELARKMTYRIAPARIFRASLPILISVLVILIIAVRG